MCDAVVADGAVIFKHPAAELEEQLGGGDVDVQSEHLLDGMDACGPADVEYGAVESIEVNDNRHRI